MTVRTAQRSELEFVIDDLGKEFFCGKYVDGSWEPGTYSVFDKYVDPETGFIDIMEPVIPLGDSTSSKGIVPVPRT